VPEPPAAARLCHDCALVANHGVIEPGLQRVGPHRPKHASGDEHDVDPRRARPHERVARLRPQDRVLADQGAVDVAGDRLDGAREVVRELQPEGFVRKSTSAFRSDCDSDLYVVGMTPFG
jgi:hypothetical protein